MAQKQKPDPFDPHAVAPQEAIDLHSRELRRDDQGLTETVTLVLPGIPANLMQPIGHACALAILGVLDWPDAPAALVARRVSEHLTARLDALRPGPVVASGASWHGTGVGLDDDEIPF